MRNRKALRAVTEDNQDLLVSTRDYFFSAVESGVQKRKVESSIEVKEYLVGLLEFYLDARNLHDPEPITLAELWLQAQQAEPVERQNLLRKLADRSLYISGFFGDSLNRKLVDLDYYSSMGETAYASLSDLVKTSQLQMIYRTFSLQFLTYVDVLNTISQDNGITDNQSLLRLYEKYLRTGSQVAREKLMELGVVTIPQDQSKKANQ